ncbi:MAG TPA: hypothetical protein VGN71_00840 [Solirubrobacteraceae bacterium]|jgi:hypothetical protein|nr:hypothetical protein [Solirubrobacteraceae bacterium]
METPRPESDPVALRLAQASERLKAERAPSEAAAPAMTADEALVLLKTLCTELRDADLEVRRARTRIAQLAAEAAARRAPLEAA